MPRKLAITFDTSDFHRVRMEGSVFLLERSIDEGIYMTIATLKDRRAVVTLIREIVRHSFSDPPTLLKIISDDDVVIVNSILSDKKNKMINNEIVNDYLQILESELI
jgi:hypothetical protein